MHQAGLLALAGSLFADAEQRQANAPLLYSKRGARYCDLLLSRGEASEVQQRASHTIKIAQKNEWLLDIAFENLSLGRAAQALGDSDTARIHLDAAIDGLHEAGASHHLPRGYLARAALLRATGDYKPAARDLEDARDIADRSGLKLFQCDVALEDARLTLVRVHSSASAAARLANQAEVLVKNTGYLRRIPELALVRAAIAMASGDKAAARRHLAQTKRWIHEGWRCYQPEYESLCTRLGPSTA